MADATNKGGIMRNFMRAGILALALAGIIVSVTAASAASNPAVGTWRAVDHGQGCWAGGTMKADGSLGGSGACSILVKGVGHEVARIEPVNWTLLSPGTYQICANIVIKMGPPFVPAGLACFPLPATSGAPVPVPQLGPGTFGKVVLTG